MKTHKNEDEKEEQVPDALGNDKLQGEDMAKAGHGERVHPKEEKNEEPHDAKEQSQTPASNEEEKIGIP